MRTSLYVTDLYSKLYTLDPATGSAGLVGSCGITNVTDIAFHGPTLYGVNITQFLRLNPDTGQAVFIGNTGFNTNGLVVSEEGIVYAAAINGLLVTLNPVTGAGTLIGAFGGGMTSAGDLAIDANGVLYGALKSGSAIVIATINRMTGAATVVGPAGFDNIYGLALHCCRFFGCTDNGELLSINAATGAGTLIGRNAVGMSGMAARCCC